MTELVILHGDSAVTTTFAIAEGTNTQHKNVLELVRRYTNDLNEFGLVAFQTRARLEGRHGGGNTEYALLNEQQATLLMTYMKNTPIVREFKKRLVKAFYELAHRSIGAFTLPDFSNPAEAARAWAKEYDAKQIAQAQVAEMTPKALFHAHVAGAHGEHTFDEAAKIFRTGPRKFINELRNFGLLKPSSPPLPYQEYLNKGWFRVIEKPVDLGGFKKLNYQTVLTGKGMTNIGLLIRATALPGGQAVKDAA